jgi:hypothetical protein
MQGAIGQVSFTEGKSRKKPMENEEVEGDGE